MPRLSNSVPKYRKHRASGQAVVTLGGRDVYLGTHGTKARKAEYDRLVGEWLAADRSPTFGAPSSELTVGQLDTCPSCRRVITTIVAGLSLAVSGTSVFDPKFLFAWSQALNFGCPAKHQGD